VDEVLMLFDINHHMSVTVISDSQGYLVCNLSQSIYLQLSVHILDPDWFIF